MFVTMKYFFNLKKELNYERELNKRLRQWIIDLQDGMSVNCVYCGHNYGPKDDIPISMPDKLRKHIEICPEHPLNILGNAVKKADFVFDNNQIADYIFAEYDRLREWKNRK